MERESRAAACRRRDEASPEDVIVLASGPPPRQPRPLLSAAAAAGRLNQETAEKVLYKTKLCEKFEVSGRCIYEGGCIFAHGHAELRPPRPGHAGGWKRPAEDELPRAGGPGGFHGGGRVCFEFRDTGSCSFGDHCSYSHAPPPADTVRFHGGAKPAAEERRNAARPASRASSPAPRRSNGYAPTPSTARAFSPGPAAAGAAGARAPLRQQPEKEDGKATGMAILSLRKLNGIYGDWPEGC